MACEIKCDYLLIDDLAGRKLAKEMGVAVKGTMGVLLYAKQHQVIAQIKPYLDRVQQTNFRISDGLIKRLLIEANE